MTGDASIDDAWHHRRGRVELGVVPDLFDALLARASRRGSRHSDHPITNFYAARRKIDSDPQEFVALVRRDLAALLSPRP